MAYRDHLITTMDQLESLYGEKLPTSMIKEIDHISEGYRKLIEAAPFIAVATSGPTVLIARRKATRPGSSVFSMTGRWQSPTGPATTALTVFATSYVIRASRCCS